MGLVEAKGVIVLELFFFVFFFLGGGCRYV